MARLAVLCVLFACFAVAVYGQATCDPKVFDYAALLDANGNLVVDALKVPAGVKGSIKFQFTATGSAGSVSIDFQKNQGWTAAPGVAGRVDVVRVIPPTAASTSSMNVLVTIALAALALVSQRGSFAAVAIAVALCVAVTMAACPFADNLEVIVNVDQKTLNSFELKIKADAKTQACPAEFPDTTSEPRLTPQITKTVTGTECSIKYQNTLYGCDHKDCGAAPSTSHVASTTCDKATGTCNIVCTPATDWADCDKNPANGCEASLADAASCGACPGTAGSDCSKVANVNKAITCDAGVGANGGFGCTAVSIPADCKTGFSDCDKDASTGCEAPTDADALNCGGCGTDCSKQAGINPNAVWKCVASVCTTSDAPCDTNKLDCPNGMNDGCETSATDSKTCGDCKNDCTTGVNYDAVSCNLTNTADPCAYTCKGGFDNCDTTPGCETSVTSDAQRCGSCSNDCTKLDGVDPLKTSCAAGKCVIACATGFDNCDGDDTNGCETAVTTDVANCGTCKNKCADLPNIVSPTCTAGVCGGSCPLPNFDQCTKTLTIADVGCPDDLQANITNCGGCGNTCSQIANAVKKCVAGVCDIQSCNANFGNCDANNKNGCESDLKTSVQYCGGCSATSTPAGVNCNTAVLNAAAVCTAGVCDYTACTGAFLNCDGDRKNGCEINPLTDVTKCGGCSGTNAGGQSVVCGSAAALKVGAVICNAGACDYTGGCTGTYRDCDAKKWNGCEIDTATSATNCGACNSPTAKTANCPGLPNVASSIMCVAGKCDTASAGACASGWLECDGDYTTGCEVDATKCTKAGTGVCSIAMTYGGAGFDCAGLVTDASKHVASASCNPTTGFCDFVCSSGYSDCNKVITDGCEASAIACSSDLTAGQGCQTALKDGPANNGQANCLALANNATFNYTVVLASKTDICDSTAGAPTEGKCKYTCATNYFDCDQSATNGCEIDTRKCPTGSLADCVFNNNTRCGYGDCINCLTLSGSTPGASKCVANGTLFQCTVNSCNASLCIDADGDWKNGCESAQGYLGAELGRVDCSKDIDLTNVLISGPILCIGDSNIPGAGRCDFQCQKDWKDCDGSPLNGCETFVGQGAACDSCVFMADVQCGKNKCVDCTLLEGTLLSDYANGRYASASASTCLPYNGTVDKRITDYYCDTSVHYLNPRYDPPNGHNGACQSELCRDLDENWANGCESAQGYGRGRFYYYGDEYNTDSFLVPYVPNHYQARFYEYKYEMVAKDSQNNLMNTIMEDIKAFSPVFTALFAQSVPPFTTIEASLEWDQVVGYVTGADTEYTYNRPAFRARTPIAPPLIFAEGLLKDSLVASDGFSPLTSREVVLLHYTLEPEFLDEPAEAAELVLIPEPYLTPKDCELSEWSDWGLCTYEDSCFRFDFFRQTKIRTREVVRPASGGGVCHLPLVEDFYRFSHRQGTMGNGISYNSVIGFESLNTLTGNDFQHGGGLGWRVDYTGKSYLDNVFEINKIKLWSPFEWNVTSTWSSTLNGFNADAKVLSWTGDLINDRADGNLSTDSNGRQFGRLLTCAPQDTCTYTDNVPKRYCNITAWSAWSRCSADCDGDWAGGVRIRTRTVITGAAAYGECFSTEFDEATGEALVDNAGMLYEEDWQCNDHSCSSYNCTLLGDKDFAADNHIYLGADAVWPQCDGRDWSEYVNGAAFIDFNRDGGDDNAFYAYAQQKLVPYEGNFPLFWTIFNFSYEYRWPGHCLYECEEGWFDCDHDPRNGCETNGDFCSIDAEFDSITQLRHPILPWEHPHGECTVSWDNSTIYRDCTDYNNQDPILRWTTGLCNFWDKNKPDVYGKCDLTCDAGFTNCFGDGCLPVTPLTAALAGVVNGPEYCGSKCIDCGQLNRFVYGAAGSGPAYWTCAPNKDDTDYTCVSTGCQLGCEDLDGDLYNGCETAAYVQLPYPDVEPFEVEYDNWSVWSPCSHADQCGYLWDLNTGVGVFRNVPIQTRARRPVKSAYNGGFYDEFSYVGRLDIEIDGVSFPPTKDFDVTNGRLGLTPPLSLILNVPLVQTPFYEVKVCSTLPAPCIECTNQLEGLEEHCVLSQWSKWSACSAECVDRVADPWYYDNTNYIDMYGKGTYDDRNFDITNYWVLNRQPYQIRTRTVNTPARRGGRCPPPGDTWQVAEAASHVELIYQHTRAGEQEQLIDAFMTNSLMSAKASYLVDIRKCNSDLCEYPEDCDALNYYYPGHFKSIVTCVPDTVANPSVANSMNGGSSNLKSRCKSNDQDSVNNNRFYCDEMNGYCSDANYDIRDGCESFVYPTACGRALTGGHDKCDYANFRDCTTLPGVTSPFASPCVNEGIPDVYPLGNHDHKCDILWACDDRLCTDETYHLNKVSAYLSPLTVLPVDSWKDGCEVARNYMYPFVTVDSIFDYTLDAKTATYYYGEYIWSGNVVVHGNPITSFYDWAVLQNNTNYATSEQNINWVTFADSLGRYTLNSTTNSKLFNIDCSALLLGNNVLTAPASAPVNVYYCAADETVEANANKLKTWDFYTGDVRSEYSTNYGCHLIGDLWEDAYLDLGFGCNGVWGTPNAGTCVMKCAAGYVDADLDPRNGCETDLFEKATPEDRFAWVGDCKSTTINASTSCGADLCVDCTNLPGLATPRGTLGSATPNCTLVEEWIGRIPVLNENDYYAIQYACGINNGGNYLGEVDFRDTYCPIDKKCYDADGDWTNGCEQGRGYARGKGGKYVMGADYDDIFDYFNFLDGTIGDNGNGDLEWPTDRTIIDNLAETNTFLCNKDFINPAINYASNPPAWYNVAAGVCDRRSSGFEFPVPGASYFSDIRSVPVDAVNGAHVYAESTLPVLKLAQWILNMEALQGYFTTLADPSFPVLPIRTMLNNRGFDCSLPYSTELLYEYDWVTDMAIYYGRDQWGAGRGSYTFGQVFHVNSSAYVNGVTGVCNIADGFCQYVCEKGWGDFDLDPSNGCEADLSGPCGAALKKYNVELNGVGTYQSAYSCGADCVDCSTLPGAYDLPYFQSACYAAHPMRFHYNQPKADYVLKNSRFINTCSTESIQSDQNHTGDTAYQFVICDPRKCFDKNFEHIDGCELATNYPESWALTGANGKAKSAYKHWFSPITETSGQPHIAETTYWVREDGLLAIARSTAAPTDLPDHWAPVFNFLSTGNVVQGEGMYKDLDGVSQFVDNFWFSRWDVTAAPGYVQYNWQAKSAAGYDVFPVAAGYISSAYDCSNAYVASGITTIGAPVNEDVAWMFTPNHKGPWYHVNQSTVSQCTAGYDPAASQLEFQAKTNVIMSQYCTVTVGLKDKPDFLCYSSWKFPGQGRCKLACETNWADGDGDPTNGCESYLLNGLPYPASQCGSNFKVSPTDIRDPALSDYKVASIDYNFNQAGSCGAGVCLSCTSLGGVSKLATNTTWYQGPESVGMRSYCIDGGDNWVTADAAATLATGGAPVPIATTNVGYPGDFYCTGIINQKACRRLKLQYPCLKNAATCPESYHYPHKSIYDAPPVYQFELYVVNASFINVCEDRDGLWETGCEYAHGYNLNSGTNASFVYPATQYNYQNGNDVTTLAVQYDRAVGVRPSFDFNFKPISYTGAMSGADGGFDCEILRLLPRAHTHITPETLIANKIECAEKGNAGPATCSFTCDGGWADCDMNPWNGCEQSKLLCGGIAVDAGCQTAMMYPTRLDCSKITQTELARSSFCDGNQIPFDDWIDFFASSLGWDEKYYADKFEIYDHGIGWVDVKYNYVNPDVSRYTIKGYWDNVDIDYSCRIWSDIDSVTFKLRNATKFPIPADANWADGKCVIDCLESNGYSDCDGDDTNGCDEHNRRDQCRAVDGECITCIDLPGTVSGLASDCLGVNPTTKKNYGTIAFNWAIDTGVVTDYSFTYGSVGTPISNEFPQCDTRSELQIATGYACDSKYCRDYDADWENGCEFPMGYGSRIEWETQQATYGTAGVIYDGFDCSWIADPQPDAGGRNYGGKTWAQKYHVNTNVSNGGADGSCIGDPNNAKAGLCNIVCEENWSDCDGDPSNGCENSELLCGSCVLAYGYDGVDATVNCSTLNDAARGFVPFPQLPKCNGREGEDGQCSYYFCNIFEGYCDTGLSEVLNNQGCFNLTSSANEMYCGADWNWRDLRNNESTVSYWHVMDDHYSSPGPTGSYYMIPDYLGGRMLDYSNFDGTGRCATCTNLGGYESQALCQYDPVVAGHTFDKMTYYKPGAAGFIDNGLGFVMFETAGNTVGNYLCQLHGEIGVDDDGECDRRYCVDEDYFWANGCETAVRYSLDDILSLGTAGTQRDDTNYGAAEFGFDYHFAYNDDVFGTVWPYNTVPDVSGNTINGGQVSSSIRSNIRGIWCPFLQFWSLSTDNYLTGDCDVFPCPHFAPSTVDTWITCVNNVTLADAGKCNFVCNVEAGWKDCDKDPMTGCETDIFNDGTCGSGCERVECNSVDGLNPWYWSECVPATSTEGVTTSACDLTICDQTLCKNLDGDWTNGCESAMKYPEFPAGISCRTLNLTDLHFAKVLPCNGEAGHHMAGMCEFECEPGWIDCDGKFSNGCEHDGSLCQDCKFALGYVTYFDGADWWEYWGPAVHTASKNDFYKVVYGSSFYQSSTNVNSYKLVVDPFKNDMDDLLDQFDGPNVPYAQYHRAYVAAFDCTTLGTTYPGQFKTGVAIGCDSDVNSAQAGLCTYACDETKGYYDCDGDPRNGCEHESLHESCGTAGACRNCYYISGVEYPVDKDNDGINDGAQGPYTDGAFGTTTGPAGRNYSWAYFEDNVTYFSRNTAAGVTPSYSTGLNMLYPDPQTSPLRLGCILKDGKFVCNLDSCVVAGDTRCKDFDQGNVTAHPQGTSWWNGCEQARAYDFDGNDVNDTFDCSLMGPDASKGDAPRDTTNYKLPSFHVRQRVGTVGCDSHSIPAGAHKYGKYANKGAWRYVLARQLRADTETEGDYAFDFEGLDNYFDDSVADFPLYRVRGSDRAGTCYYECEYGYEDCNGDPRDGCEILLSACIDNNGKIGWDWTAKKASDACETALGYTFEELAIPPNTLQRATFACTDLRTDPTVNASMPIYCRGGQDGQFADGKCQFTCNAGFEDCDGNPDNGCEAEVNDNSCSCVNCAVYLPGTKAMGAVGSAEFAVSQSTCDNTTNPASPKCRQPCDETLCKDFDGIWENGCEVAMQYPAPRVGSSANTSAIGPFDCSIWSKNLLLAKKQHINIKALGEIYCEGRADGPEPGTCSFQSACLNTFDNGLHDYQDCNNDPRDGCEDTGRWCSIGASVAAPRATQSDRCSKANRYICDDNGFNALDGLCTDLVTGFILDYPATVWPSVECYALTQANAGTLYNVNNVVANGGIVPYCDRDPTHLETRGDCIFKCKTLFADCNNNARDGCEANVTLQRTCDYDCVDCLTLSGRDQTGGQPVCVADPLNIAPVQRYKCLFNCTFGICEDKDKDWKNGCEVAMNNDRDSLGVFMNIGEDMDCSVMQEEVYRNPEFFVHHLHIDLTTTIPNNVDTIKNLAGGTIFCNNGLVDKSRTAFGHCHFECIFGFANANGLSFDGCEARHATNVYPYVFGGYWIGDFHAEEYLDFLCDINNGSLQNSKGATVILHVPTNVCISFGTVNPATPGRRGTWGNTVVAGASVVWY